MAKNRRIEVSFGQFRAGKIPPLRERLVYYARNFRNQSPVKICMKSGFYDTPLVSTTAPLRSQPVYKLIGETDPRWSFREFGERENFDAITFKD
jgi:hypothetical protein